MANANWDKIRESHTERERDLGVAVPSSVALAYRARDAVEKLLDHDGKFSGTKNDFALAMDWVRPDGKPIRDWVEGVCTYTRDHPDDPLTGGYVISYAPTKGGMVLWTGEEEVPLDHYIHMFQGDMTRDNQHRTENRRRRHVWSKAAQQAHESGDLELARLLNYAENEINSTGFVAESTSKQLGHVFASRGLDQ
jgi:hypothetical protein